ncbi:MAG: hypothetical protein NZ898_11815 [Myxococcota bacterium]|nr:hypothetical protein [Myxococcota bacterium]MDW8362769.1 hypothetical protein [Myxococcales bacterium]
MSWAAGTWGAWWWLVACGGGHAPADGSARYEVGATDTMPVDVRSEALEPDVPGGCVPPCAPPTRCCEGRCVDVRIDPEHCGRCGLRCAAGRGTECRNGDCVCGTVRLGCAGDRGSTCCPPREDGGMAYCADFVHDTTDCGGCGMQCDPWRADRCDDGLCRCGPSRGQCAGTAEDRCCDDGRGEIRCVDTTSDRDHCGGCAMRCGVGQRCTAGRCVDVEVP